MKFVRPAALLLHLAGLTLGLFFAAAAINSVATNFSSDFLDVALSRIATAASLTAVVLAFALLIPLRGFTPLAPVLFAPSYALVGLMVEGNGRAMAKSFAPADPEEFGYLYTMSIVEILVAFAIAFFLWTWTYRRSRVPFV